MLTASPQPPYTHRHVAAMSLWWKLPFRDFVAKELTRPGFREFAVGAV